MIISVAVFLIVTRRESYARTVRQDDPLQRNLFGQFHAPVPWDAANLICVSILFEQLAPSAKSDPFLVPARNAEAVKNFTRRIGLIERVEVNSRHVVV